MDAAAGIVGGRASVMAQHQLLMVIAVVGAAVTGEWAEAASMVFFFGVAEWLEGWADRRALRATEAVLQIVPKTGRSVCSGARG